MNVLDTIEWQRKVLSTDKNVMDMNELCILLNNESSFIRNYKVDLIDVRKEFSKAKPGDKFLWIPDTLHAKIVPLTDRETADEILKESPHWNRDPCMYFVRKITNDLYEMYRLVHRPADKTTTHTQDVKREIEVTIERLIQLSLMQYQYGICDDPALEEAKQNLKEVLSHA